MPEKWAKTEKPWGRGCIVLVEQDKMAELGRTEEASKSTDCLTSTKQFFSRSGYIRVLYNVTEYVFKSPVYI